MEDGAPAGDGVEAVFINLDRALERRRFMEAQGERLGIRLARQAAVRAEDVSQPVLDALNGRWERPLSQPELGCFLSHRTLWQRIAAGDWPVLVLEDDVMLSCRLPDALPRLAALAGVDLINLESFDRRRFVARASRAVADGVSVVRVHRDKSGSAAYLLWPAGARKLLKRAERGAAPVDAFLHGAKAVLSWQVEPALAVQLHIRAARGLPVPIPAGSSIQAPRLPLSLNLKHLPFHLRRISTQLRLGREHAMRLFGRRYRRTVVVDADFDHNAS